MNKNEVSIENWPYTQWMAHRGAGKIAPENTLKAFKVGYDFGFRGVEFDVKITKDNQSVVIHDNDLKRVAGIGTQVKDLLLEEIMHIDAGVGYPQYQPAYVPSFKAIADFCVCNNIGSNVEIKPCSGREIETAEIVANDAIKFWQNSTIPPLFSSFSLDALQVVQKIYPDSLRGLLIEDWSEDDEEIISQLKMLECVSLHAQGKDLTKSRVVRIKKEGYAVLAWTVNDLNRAKELISWGVDGIITDLVDQVFK
ncbi:glycerophosphodiester phosphodiesterase [Neisseriaceae bacterium PsAf]|nr:glycerophosphodiester phosphodiesterase [Neisseriaceae bacterium PsAf]MCV2502502.1 glycerophosphodiester phosphodiesterase family protein [Neisseriaceae bacterium]